MTRVGSQRHSKKKMVLENTVGCQPPRFLQINIFSKIHKHLNIFSAGSRILDLDNKTN